ncbi:MAG: MiaB/RimO family radical SAM methylthiotransferase [Kiritimatiellia bacterium]|nr:MiaB/RimO family radical SAM methylthiotransferase [Kiritimatiellia bacterium]
MKTRPATVSFKTVGCRLNQAETAVMRAAFEEAGFKTVRFGEPCDICVIHGCVVTARAEEDSLRLARSVKHRYPNAFMVLAGCAAEFLKNGTRPVPEQINYLAGQKEKFNLPEILGKRFQTTEKHLTVPVPLFNTKRAIVKIQDGCDFHCAYCIVPSVRGTSRSRPAAEIIEEITRLTLTGFPEIVLTGANIGCYADDADRLPQLLEKIEVIPGLQRLRISSLEIATVEREIIDFMASSKKMCRCLHLPLQSGSDSVLKAMGRPYTAEQYCSLVKYAQEKLGLFGLGTDIIAGFPGETENDLLATEQIVRQLPFSKLHVFGYSPRPGTLAASLPGQVSHKDKETRVARLIELGRKKRNEFARSLVGQRVSFLVEKNTPDGWAEGWTGEYIWARTHGTGLKLKQIVECVCENAQDDILLGSFKTKDP